MQYQIDTDWSIDHLHNVPAVSRRIAELAPAGIGISIITIAELYNGVVNSRNPEREESALFRFLDAFTIIDVDVPICRIFGTQRARLRAAGMSIEDLDLLIGATAIHHHLTLLTNNRRHFGRLPGLNIISV